MITNESISIPDLKVQLATKMKNEKSIDVNPTHLRIREIWNQTPYLIYYNCATLKENMKYISQGKQLAVQILSEPECVENDEYVTPFIQRWFPSTYTLHQKTELSYNKHISCSAFQELLSEKTGIPFENLGWVKVQTGTWLCSPILEIPQLPWDRSLNQQYTYSVHDGDLILYRDNREPQKELTKEEKVELRKREKSTHSEEKALHINVNN